ncbi:MAG TPA: hypothetical protein VGP36_21840 [Mycobacteriales bacterium]|jgi:hypothetical protein|nr:hypothetical protein [Mycobacteriales bacterium]
MDEQTRRGFLIMAGAGAVATAGIAVVAAGAAGASTPDAPAPAALPQNSAGPVVAYVSDVRTGRVSIMVGEKEVVVSDPDLVARLSAHVSGAKA